MGGTHDLSAGGMSLVLPSVRADERFPASQNPTVDVTVRTPGGSVEMKATVMYVLADERNSSHASIVGLRIDKISGRTQTLLMNYLNEIC
jgi:c-di-GMP-binding flagellar brake protein YcgR